MIYTLKYNIIYILIYCHIRPNGPIYITVLDVNAYIKCQRESFVCFILKALNMNEAHFRGKSRSSVLNIKL